MDADSRGKSNAKVQIQGEQAPEAQLNESTKKTKKEAIDQPKVVEPKNAQMPGSDMYKMLEDVGVGGRNADNLAGKDLDVEELDAILGMLGGESTIPNKERKAVQQNNNSRLIIGNLLDNPTEKIIVDPAHEKTMNGNGGVSGAIKKMYEKKGLLRSYVKDLVAFPKNEHGKRCPNGEARYTNTGGIDIIHVSAPDLREKKNLQKNSKTEPSEEAKEKLKQAYYSAFVMAHNLNKTHKYLSCPLLGAGIFGWPPTLSAEIAGRAMQQFREEYSHALAINIYMRKEDLKDGLTSGNLQKAIEKGQADQLAKSNKIETKPIASQSSMSDMTNSELEHAKETTRKRDRLREKAQTIKDKMSDVKGRVKQHLPGAVNVLPKGTTIADPQGRIELAKKMTAITDAQNSVFDHEHVPVVSFSNPGGNYAPHQNFSAAIGADNIQKVISDLANYLDQNRHMSDYSIVVSTRLRKNPQDLQRLEQEFDLLNGEILRKEKTDPSVRGDAFVQRIAALQKRIEKPEVIASALAVCLEENKYIHDNFLKWSTHVHQNVQNPQRIEQLLKDVKEEIEVMKKEGNPKVNTHEFKVFEKRILDFQMKIGKSLEPTLPVPPVFPNRSNLNKR